MDNLNALFCISLQQTTFVYVLKRRSNTQCKTEKSHTGQIDLTLVINNARKMDMNLLIQTNCASGILYQQYIKQLIIHDTHNIFFYLRNNVSKTYFKIFNIHMKICFLKW